MRQKTNFILIVLIVALVFSVTYTYIQTVKRGNFQIINNEEEAATAEALTSSEDLIMKDVWVNPE